MKCLYSSRGYCQGSEGIALTDFVHLYRNKWLCIAPTEIQPGYYAGELDDDGELVSDYTVPVEVHDIVISKAYPGIVKQRENNGI